MSRGRQILKKDFDDGVLDGSIHDAYVETGGGPYGDKEPYSSNVVAVGIMRDERVWAYVKGWKSKEPLECQRKEQL